MPYLSLRKIVVWPQMAFLLINSRVFISNKFHGIEFFKFIFKLTSLCESKVNHLQFRADDFCFVIHIWNSCFIQSLWINTRGISLLPEHTEPFVASVYLSYSCSRGWLPIPFRCTQDPPDRMRMTVKHTLQDCWKSSQFFLWCSNKSWQKFNFIFLGSTLTLVPFKLLPVLI